MKLIDHGEIRINSKGSFVHKMQLVRLQLIIKLYDLNRD